MQYARKLRKGDKVAIVSLSSGMLGEEFCSHNIEIGVKRLKEYGLEPVFMPNALKGIEYLKAHPEARAKDLKDAFLDESIAGIICAIGGDDTYRLLPYLMEDDEFIKAVEKHPKLFTGFSDTTINHFMFYKLGLSTYYGPNFICDLGEIADEMLPYTKRAFEGYLEGNEFDEIVSSDIWYEEREDFVLLRIALCLADPYERFHIRPTNEMLREAFSYANKAMEKGDIEAYLIVGWFYEKGEVVRQDFELAHKYIKIAADNGNEIAKEHIKIFKKNIFGKYYIS